MRLLRDLARLERLGKVVGEMGENPPFVSWQAGSDWERKLGQDSRGGAHSLRGKCKPQEPAPRQMENGPFPLISLLRRHSPSQEQPHSGLRVGSRKLSVGGSGTSPPLNAGAGHQGPCLPPVSTGQNEHFPHLRLNLKSLKALKFHIKAA